MNRTLSPRKFVADTLRWLGHRVLPATGGMDLSQPPLAPWQAPAMPEWVAQELKALASLEPELLSADDNLSKYSYYSVPTDSASGNFYSELIEVLPCFDYSHIFFVPWLKPGGADRGTLHHLNGLRNLDPEAKILVVATERSESQWKERIPEGVDFIEAGLLPTQIDFDKQVTAFTRLLVQIRPKAVHIINSRVGWEAVRRHGLAITQNTRLYASLFCDDYNKSHRPVGYAREYLRDTWQHFVTIFCDNRRYPHIWSNLLGVPHTAFTVLPFPYDGIIPDAVHFNNAVVGGARVLWAGRLDYQKRPDILLEIAKRLPEFKFDVHGAAVVDSEQKIVEQLKLLPNVCMHGVFNSLADVVMPEHVAYLMTTSWEGMPTILFDVAAAGIPIVAPPIGGIPDFVSPDQLVDNPEDVDGFVQQLRRYAQDRASALEAAGKQIETLRKERSWDGFLMNLKAIDGYVEPI